MNKNKILLSELLRPRQLGQLALTKKHIERFEQMIQSGAIMNMIFHGHSGLGKTSAARAIVDALKADVYVVNGSSGNGAADVKQVERFATCVSLLGASKICFIDEADFLSQSAQASLRHLIENTSANCRYLFTANNIEKINEALRSRMKEISFDITPSDRTEVMVRLIKRYQEALPKFGIQYDEKRLREIVGIYFPDLRAIANEFEYEFVTGQEQIAA